MTMVAGQFERVAATVAVRTGELLCAQVIVADEFGTVVASNDSALVGRALHGGTGADHVRFPVRVHGQTGEVIVAPSNGGEAVSPRLAQALVELVINQTAVVARLPNQHELKNKFIHDLLRGPARDEADLLREGQVLGMNFARPRAVVLIDASDYIESQPATDRPEAGSTRARRRAQLVIASIVGFFDLPNDTICGYIGDGEIAVLKASSTQDLAEWTDRSDGLDQASPSWSNLTALKRAGNALLARLQRDAGASINIGIGRYHPGLQGLARSYQDARAALTLGRRFLGRNRVHCLDGLGVAAFVGLADEDTKVDLATHLLSPLDHEPELMQTLDVFFGQDCCPSSTSRQLNIHRNTLGYRLDKITSLTGLDPRHFDDAVQIRLALVLRSLRHQSA